MELMQRPVKNLKQINLKLIGFAGFFVMILVLFALPKDSLGGIGEGLQFMFSPEFYTPVEKEQFDLTTSTMNNIYEFMNVVKVAFWCMALLGIIIFLFKKPYEDKAENTENPLIDIQEKGKL